MLEAESLDFARCPVTGDLTIALAVTADEEPVSWTMSRECWAEMITVIRNYIHDA